MLDLGCEIVRGSDYSVGFTIWFGHFFCEGEGEKIRIAVFIQDYVLRLEIPKNYEFFMQILKEIDDSHGDEIDCLFGWKIYSFNEATKCEIQVFPIYEVKVTIVFESFEDVDHKHILKRLVQFLVIR